MTSLFTLRALRGIGSQLCRPAIMSCRSLPRTAGPPTSTPLRRPFSLQRLAKPPLATLVRTPQGIRAYASMGGALSKKELKAKKSKKKKKGGKRGTGRAALTEDERKLKALRTNLFHVPPPPLRMGRNRHLRHWTIHRAWLLRQRERREARLAELTRMRQGMANACEELRLMAGPYGRGEGYLYRVAMEKKGVYRHGGIPIEYARLQTETPAREPWNYAWKRPESSEAQGPK